MRRAFVTAVAMLVWCPPGWAQRPSDAVASALIEKGRAKALDYARSLPDFVCTEAIRRYAGSMAEGLGGHPIDTLTIQLRYFQHQEDHKLTLVDGKPARQTFETLQGAIGSGDSARLSAPFSMRLTNQFPLAELEESTEAPGCRVRLRSKWTAFALPSGENGRRPHRRGGCRLSRRCGD
jgi:hypothetical protein